MPTRRGPSPPGQGGDDDAHRHLGAQQHERLVKLLLERAETDSALRDRLLLEAADAGEGVDPSSYRRHLGRSERRLGRAGERSL